MYKMNHKLKTLFAALLIVGMLPIAVLAQGQQLADPGDFFDVYAPAPNATVTGNTTFSWKGSDDDQANVPYQLTLLRTNCLTQVGVISAGSNPSSMSTFSVNWPSGGPIQGASNIPDGSYCVELCLSLLNGSQPYSACNLRIIRVRNSNSLPNFTSNPPADREITPSENWSYDANATDPDGDALTYSLGQHPGFIKINASTGLVQTKPQTKSPGTYTVTIRVTDTFGGQRTQTFQLTVVEDSPTDGGTDGSTDGGTDGDEQPQVQVTFSSPGADEVLRGTDSAVAWNIEGDTDRIESIKLQYALLGQSDEWNDIVTLSQFDSGSYLWDIEGINSGSYILRMEVLFDDDSTLTFLSDGFDIDTQGGSNVSQPLITEVNPENLSEIRETRPLIIGKFVPSQGATINTETFDITLDDEGIADLCELTQDGFSCELASDLSAGAHQVHARISDSSGEEGQLIWNFVVLPQDTGGATDGSTDGEQTGGQAQASNTLALIVLICIVAAILLIVPWILYGMWKRRKDREIDEYQIGDTNIQVNYEQYDQPEEIDPSKFSSYEDYFAAATGSATPQTVVNYYETPEVTAEAAEPVSPPVAQATAETPTQPAASDQNQFDYSYTGEGVTTPDYTDFYKDTATGSETPVAEDAESSSPEWLNPVDSGAKPSTGSSEPLAKASEPVTAPPENTGNKDEPLGSYGYGTKVDE